MNSLVEIYRKHYPEDLRGDDELTVDLSRRYPDLIPDYPDAQKDLDRINQEVAEAMKPGTMDYVKQAGGSVIRGATETIAGLPKSMGVASDALTRAVPALGAGVAFDSEFPYVHPMSPSNRQQRTEEGEGNALTAAGKGISALGEKASPEPVDQLNDSFLVTKLPNTLGSIAGFVAGGGIGKALMGGSIKAVMAAAAEDAATEAIARGATKEVAIQAGEYAAGQVAKHASVKFAEMIPTGVLGAGTQSAGAYEEAIQKGATPDQAFYAYLLNIPVGAAMALPAHQILGEGQNFIGKLARDTITGTGVMAAQAAAGNAIAKNVYDPSRKLSEGVGEGAGAGAIVTAALSALSHGLAKGSKSPNSEPSAEPTAPSTDQAPKPINPMVTYQLPNDIKAKVDEVLARELSGDKSESLDVALAGIYSEPNVFRYYTSEKERLKVEQAAAKTNPNPTDAQKEAGNYAKGKVTIDGLDISIENPAGSERRGVDADGNPWSVTMPANYGYFLGTEGKDGDHVDTYIGPNPASDKVYAVDQINHSTGKFDEHKIMLGFESRDQALAAYDAAFSDGKGPQRRGAVTEMTKDQLKTWLNEGNTSNPIGKLSVEKPMDDLTLARGVLEKEGKLGISLLQRREGLPYARAEAAVKALQDAGEIVRPDPAGPWIKASLDNAPPASVEAAGRVGDPDARVTPPAPTAIPPVAPQEASPVEAVPLPAVQTEPAPAPVAQSWQKLAAKPEELTNRVAFGKAQVAGKEAGAGKKAAEAYVETNNPDELFKDVTANAKDRNQSRKLGVFESADGSHVLVGTAYENGRGEAARKVTFFDESGKPKAIQFRNLVAAGYRLVASIKTTDATKGYAVTYSPQEWSAIAAELNQRRESDRSGGVSPAPESVAKELVGGAEGQPQGGSIVGTPNAPVNEWRTPGGKIEPELAKRLIDSIGEPKWESQEQADEQIVDGFSALDIKEQQALLEAVSPKDARSGEIDYVEGFERLKEKIYDDYEKGRSQSEIAGALSGRREKGGAASASKVSEPGSADAGPVGGSSTGAAGSEGTGAGEVTKFSDRGEGVKDVASNTQLKSVWDGALDAAAANGLKIDVVQGLREGGVYSPRAVALTVADPLNPTRDNVVLLFHEIGHDVFTKLNLPSALEAAFHRAIAKLATPEGFNIKLAPGADASAVRAEEVLVERAARNLVAEGFNPDQARGVGQRLVHFLKDLYVRAALAIQRAMLGEEHVNPELAQQYFENRMRSFLAGDEPMSFLSFLGGPKPTTEQRGDFFPQTGGSGAIAGTFNPIVGEMEYRAALPETMDALQFNQSVVRFSDRPAGTAFVKTADPHVISRDLNSPVKVEEDVAAYNALHDIHMAAFRAFDRANPGKLTFEKFVEYFTNADTPAPHKIKSRNEELVANQMQPVDPTLRPADLTSEASQMQAADKAYHYAWSLREFWSRKRKDAESFLKTSSERLARKNTQLHELAQNYTNAELVFSQARERAKELLDSLRNSVHALGTEGHRLGTLEQVIQNLEGTINRPLLTQYEKAINRLYLRLAKDSESGQRFTDMLERVAHLDVDWKTTPSVEIRDAIRLIAKGDALLEPFVADTPDARALLALAVAFGKSNAHVMDFLRLRRSDALEERQVVNEALAKAMESGANAIGEAREIVRKLPKLGKVADRLLSRLNDMRDENRQLLDETQRARVFVDFHQSALPGLQAQMTQLERTIGARLQSWEANNNAEYYVAPKVDSTDGAVLANKQVFKLSGVESNENVIAHIRQNNAWLNAVPEEKRGAVWNTVKEMTVKLEHTVALAEHELVIKKSTVNYYFGSIVDKLESTGLPALRAAAMRMRRYLAERHAASADADNIGIAWAAAESKAMTALGMKDAGKDKFQRLFFQSALSFAEKNPDIRAAFKGDKEAFDALLPRLRKYLENDPDTREQLTRDGAWSALEAYYRATYPAMEMVNAFRKKMGLKIQEVGADGLKIEREPIGSTFFTAMRRINRGAVRMYQSMRDAGWLGTGEGGKMEAGKITELYANNPDALTAVAQRLFTPGVWRDFVKPLANMEGRSAFYGPERVDGISPIALREHVAKAFDAAGGSPVRFAELLYQLESANGDVRESKGEFVGKTMQAFQEFFDSIHNTQKEHDDSLRHGIPTPPRLLQDARISEAWPGEWLDYQTYGRFEMHQMVNLLSAQGAFGRNIEGMQRDLQAGINDLSAKAEKFRAITDRVVDANPGKKGKALQALVRKAVEREGENYTSLSQADRNLAMARNEQGQFESLMKLQGGLALELRPFMELVSAMAGATVQGPGTALMQFADFGQPFAKLGLGPTAVRVLRQTVKSFAAEQIGTLAQMFHTQIGWNADRNARRVRNGILDSDARRKFSDAARGLIEDTTMATNPATRTLFKVARGLRLLTSSGIGKAPEESATAYVTAKPHAVFSQFVLQQQFAFIDGWVSGFEDMVERAVKHFKDPANAGDVTDPAFKFTKLADLGYNKGFLGLGSDERAFKYFYNALARYGMSLEQVARDVAAQRAKDPAAPALTDEQFRSLASQVQNEITLDSNPATRPSSTFTNPVLRMASPLISWSIAKSHDSWENWRNPDMSQTSRNFFKAFGTGLLPYAALVPIGLGVAMLRDKYDEDVLGKKANRQEPLNSFASMVDAMGWVGTFGIFGDAANSFINRDTQRPFSVDNRVFFVSSLLAAKRALQNWYEQGSADYQTVYRPLLASMGGSGYLQYAQILNNAMSLDNAEARVTAKLNAQNYLRVAGRELNMDVRVSTGGESISNPIKPYIGQMVLSAYANDPVTFREAYRSALAEAKQEKGSLAEAQDYVQRSFAAYHPLRTVFKTEPSAMEVQRLVAMLPDEGHQAVASALRLFNNYAAQVQNSKGVGLKPNLGRSTSSSGSAHALTPTLNLDEIRRRAVGY
jgi:hypothetical protein